MRADFEGKIKTVTEMGYSYADASLKVKTLLKLPTYGGQLAIPGRLIRGALRHRGFAAMMERKKSNGIKYTLEDWYFDLLGGILHGGEKDYNVLIDRPLYEAHPFVGLWGCMNPVAHHGKVQVEMAFSEIPDLRPIVVSGQRTDPVQRGDLQKDDVRDGFEEYIAGMKGDRETRKTRTDKKRAKKPDDDAETDETEQVHEAKKNTANMPFSREVIPRNSTFLHHMTLAKGTTDIQLGQFLASFEAFAEDPFFGAQTGINGGIVDLDYIMSIDGREVGSLTINGRKRSFDISPKLRVYLDLFWKKFPDMDFSIPN